MGPGVLMAVIRNKSTHACMPSRILHSGLPGGACSRGQLTHVFNCKECGCHCRRVIALRGSMWWQEPV